jgi:hypothetical protein
MQNLEARIYLSAGKFDPRAYPHDVVSTLGKWRGTKIAWLRGDPWGAVARHNDGATPPSAGRDKSAPPCDDDPVH